MVQPPNTVASYCVLARCPLGGAPEADDAAALAAYFNAATRFGALSDAWAEVDARYAAVRKVVGGARVLLQAREGKKREAGVGWRDWVAQKVGCRLAAGRRPRLATPPTHPSANFLSQDPLECLISFICSSNNSIPRITSMVERLCTDYGTRLACAASLGGEGDQPSRPYHAFPTLDQLAAASEADLRAAGFGYRAKYVAGTVGTLAAKPGGGDAWLLSLREAAYADAAAALCELPGVGPKVAACVCLFALNKHAAVPVDTHVWQLAVRYYTPQLRGKAINKAAMDVVERAFVDRFGEHAGADKMVGGGGRGRTREVGERLDGGGLGSGEGWRVEVGSALAPRHCSPPPRSFPSPRSFPHLPPPTRLGPQCAVHCRTGVRQEAAGRGGRRGGRRQRWQQRQRVGRQ